MTGITWNRTVDSLNEYVQQSELKNNGVKKAENANSSQLTELQKSARQVQAINNSATYQAKVEKITKQVAENSYQIHLDQLIDQLFAENVLMEEI